jgi:hypothetical protein
MPVTANSLNNECEHRSVTGFNVRRQRMSPGSFFTENGAEVPVEHTRASTDTRHFGAFNCAFSFGANGEDCVGGSQNKRNFRATKSYYEGFPKCPAPQPAATRACNGCHELEIHSSHRAKNRSSIAAEKY